MLFVAAIIWGFAFVAQSTGGDVVGPYTFNSVRSVIGSAVLIPVMLLMDHFGFGRKPETTEEKKTLWCGGILCGLAVTFASNLQQLGITYGDSAGKAGFLTACYIIFVPILGIFLHKKCKAHIWICVLIAVVGLYLLCLSDTLKPEWSDLLVLLSAVCYAVQIMVVSHYAPMVDGVRLSSIQFLTCAVLSAVPMIFTEVGFQMETVSAWGRSFLSWSAWIPLLYAGVMSCGIAYTLQIFGEKDVNPAIASLVMSFESVFSVLGAWLLLGEQLTPRQLLGCVLIFIAVVLAQIDMEILLSKKNHAL